MNTIECIKKRRSVRKYLDKEIPDELIEKILNAARLAPSGNNAQPWEFIIIKKKETIKKFKQNNIFPQDFVYKTPLMIVCCGNPDAFPDYEQNKGLDDSNDFRAERDLSIASQNLVLAATELGLGTCYIGWLKKKEIKEILGIPNKYLVPFVITVGYPNKEGKPSKRKDLKEIIHNEKW